jgi:uncharacterized protein YlxW (UPF0749 family)
MEYAMEKHDEIAALRARVAELESALRDLNAAVDAVCDSDAFGVESTLQPHARSVLELALQRAKAAAAAGSVGVQGGGEK